MVSTVPAVDPNSIVDPVKSVPVMVTTVPPAIVPEVGDTDEILGVGR
jgi:hypothetical protein